MFRPEFVKFFSEARMRENAETSAQSTVRPGAKLTPAPKKSRRSIMNFRPLTNEEGNLKDHSIVNVCSTSGKDVDKLDKISSE